MLRLPSNTGFAPAVNLGVAACTGELVGLLNDDATAGPDWLATASETLKDPSVAAVGPKIVLTTRYREVQYPDEEWYAPGDDRPLGRQLKSVTVDGTELLDAAVGPGLYRAEGSADNGRWRWTAGQRPWYVPLPGLWPWGRSRRKRRAGASRARSPPGEQRRLVPRRQRLRRRHRRQHARRRPVR